MPLECLKPSVVMMKPNAPSVQIVNMDLKESMKTLNEYCKKSVLNEAFMPALDKKVLKKLLSILNSAA